MIAIDSGISRGWWLVALVVGCGGVVETVPPVTPPAAPTPQAAVVETTRGALPHRPSPQTAPEAVAPAHVGEADIYAEARAESVAVEGLCLLAAPGVTAHVAPFDGGVGVVVDEPGEGARLRADARLLAEQLTELEPMPDRVAGDAEMPGSDGERVFVAGHDDSHDEPRGATPALEVSIELQDGPGGVMLVFVPADPTRSGELMRRLRQDVAQLGEGRCAAELPTALFDETEPDVRHEGR